MARPKKEVKEMDTVQCTCSNVHLGNGNVLRAKQNKHGNWVKGDTAEVSAGIAKMMEERGQVKIL